MFEEYEIRIGDEVKKYKDGVTFIDIAKDNQDKYAHDIVLVMKDGKLSELFKKVTNNCSIEFITTATAPGIETYRRSVKLLMMKAFYDVAGAENIRKIVIEYSISKGFYFTVDGNIDLTEELLEKVESRMRQLVDEDLPINKRSISVNKAIALFKRHKMFDKEKLFKFRRASNVNIYSIK
ncbi:MAG: nucleoside kinase, partial [Lachnospiraceae bacterium]|nr:nucleoside kinase [Lachnospiraceae bacterium]